MVLTPKTGETRARHSVMGMCLKGYVRWPGMGNYVTILHVAQDKVGF